MISLNQVRSRLMGGLCIIALLMIGNVVTAGTPVERFVAENAGPAISIDLEETRIVSNDYDQYVRHYVEFIYDTEVSNRIMQDVPKTILVTVPTPKGDYQLRLVEKKITTNDFRVDASNREVVYNEAQGIHYHGIVDGHEGSLAAVSFFNGQMTILGSTRELGNFTVNKTDDNGRYVSYFDSDLVSYPEFECHTPDPEELPEFLQTQQAMSDIIAQRGADHCVRLHIEADYNLYQSQGDDMANTVAFVEGFFSQVAIIYANESIDLLLSYVNVWDTLDPFDYDPNAEPPEPFSTGLALWRTYLTTDEGTLNGDFGQLVGFDGGGGGISNGIGQSACFADEAKIQYTSVNPSYNNFPVYSWTVGAVAHELGHCIASPHTHGCYWNGDGTQIDDCGNIYAQNQGNTPEGNACYAQFQPVLPAPGVGGSIMSYCHLNAVGINMTNGFGQQPGDLLRAALTNSAACLRGCPEGDCAPPSSLRIEDVTDEEATISWYHATETDFEITYGYTGNSTTEQVSGLTTTLTGLTSGKNYVFFLKTLCDGASSFEVSEDFKTTCTTVYSLPFIELFDGDDWEEDRYELEGCWTNTLSDDFYGWNVLSGETTSVGTGPSVDHTSGFGKYVYAEASFGENNDNTLLLSPEIDMGAAESPFLSFWYHMNGASVNGLTLQIRKEGVPAWVTLTSIDGAQQTDIFDPWLQSILDLSNYEGETVRLRFIAKRGADAFGDIAIDDLIITDSSLVDISVSALTSPATGCGIGPAEQVIINIQNSGYQTLLSGTDIELELELNGGSITTETLTLTSDLEPGQFVGYTFTQTLNLSTPGEYAVNVISSLPGDQVSGNNARGATVISKLNITTYPYTQSFENGSDWNAGGVNSSWELGTPAKSVITGASDGDNAWVTGGVSFESYNDDEESYVEGPCFDFSNLLDPYIEMDVWWDIEDFWEGVWFQSSVDGGQTWQTIGVKEDDWYNSDTIYNMPGVDGWSGSEVIHETIDLDGSGGWVPADHALDGLGEEPSVFLRMLLVTDGAVTTDGIAFDNITINGTPIVPSCHNIALSANTCDQNQAGVDVVVLQDEDGCDSIITTTTTLLQSYDILIQEYSCDPDDVGEVVTTYTAQSTCDSVVTLRTDLWPSFDYAITVTTCDEDEVGVEDLVLTTINGCDSLVEVTTVLADPYEVTVEETTCDPDEVGSVETTLTASDGCDSIVTVNTTLTPVEADFTYVENEGVVTFTNTSSNATDYSWSFGDGNFNDTENPTNTYTTTAEYTIILIASNGDCPSDTQIVVINIVSGIDMISFIESVNVFPNPNDGNFAVEIRGDHVFEDLTFTLFNVAGSTMETRDVPFNSFAKETYNLESLSDGIYFLRIQSEDEQTTLKINVLK